MDNTSLTPEALFNVVTSPNITIVVLHTDTCGYCTRFLKKFKDPSFATNGMKILTQHVRQTTLDVSDYDALCAKVYKGLKTQQHSVQSRIRVLFAHTDTYKSVPTVLFCYKGAMAIYTNASSKGRDVRALYMKLSEFVSHVEASITARQLLHNGS